MLFKAPETQAAPARKRAVRKPGQQPGQQSSEPTAQPGDESGDQSGDQSSEQSSEKSDEKSGRPARKAKDAPQGEPDEAAGADGDDGSDDDSSEGGNRRRRRRGGRRRRKPSDGPGGDDSGNDSGDDDSESDDSDNDNDRDEGQGQGGSRRRRRRRRPGEDDDAGSDDSPKSAPRARKPRNPEDEITSIGGSTRLEAKKQRRREGREAGRRRAPIVSEAEFLARRESVERVMVIRQRDDLTQIGVLEDKVLVEHYVARESQTSLIGNVYLGRVQNVLPSMEAAFIDIGKGRNAVLYAGEVNWSALGHKDGQPRKIESVLSSGQSILVQVSKDPMGHKGARLTGQISLPGRFLVYVPEGNTSGISRKLPDTERNRLKTLLKEIVPDTAGVIVRTAAEGASEDELTRDVERLTARWSDIEEKVKSGKSPQLLYGEPDLTLKVVRDLFTEDFGKLVVQGDDAWDVVDNYVKHVAPDLSERLERFEPAQDGPDAGKDLFATYRVDEQIAKGLDRKVWLPSGGSLVIDRTEAMTVVDVNTGKFTGSGGNLEETVTKNNLEAAEEIVRQLRLRDIGGIIVVDFIDMVLESNRDLVLRRLVECLGRDRTRHQVAEVTSLGLVQMTRKRIGTGLLEAFSTECEHCKGRGLVLHDHPVDSNGRSEDDEPRGRRARGGRNRGGRSGSGEGEGRKNGNGNGGNGNGRHPTPADLAGSRPPEKLDDGSDPDDTDDIAETDDVEPTHDIDPADADDTGIDTEIDAGTDIGVGAQGDEASEEESPEPTDVPEASPAPEQNVIGTPTETQAEPVVVPSESASVQVEPTEYFSGGSGTVTGRARGATRGHLDAPARRPPCRWASGCLDRGHHAGCRHAGRTVRRTRRHPGRPGIAGLRGRRRAQRVLGPARTGQAQGRPQALGAPPAVREDHSRPSASPALTLSGRVPPPAIQDATAPIRLISAAAVNTTTRPWWKGPDIRCGKNSLPVRVGCLVVRQRVQHARRAQQRADRVVAEERGEQRPHRRQVADVGGDVVRDALGDQAAGQRLGEHAGEADDHQ